MIISKIINNFTHNIALIKKTVLFVKDKSIISSKFVLRTVLLKRRRIMLATEKSNAETIISTNLLNWFFLHPITCLGVYLPILGEPDLHFAYYILRRCGVRLCLPVIRSPNLPLDFVSWMPEDILIKDTYGTLCPIHDKVVKPNAILIPCLGFNRNRIRLGYGGGYYDRTLAQRQYSILLTQPLLTIGIAYAHARVDFISELHDIALNVIITD